MVLEMIEHINPYYQYHLLFWDTPGGSEHEMIGHLNQHYHHCQIVVISHLCLMQIKVSSFFPFKKSLTTYIQVLLSLHP